MKHIQTGFALVASLALMLGAATVSPAVADDKPAQTSPDRAVELYQQGDDYVVAVYKSDGSAVLGVVEADHVKRHRTGKHAWRPDIDDLMKKGRVKYTIRLAAGESPEAKGIDLPPEVANRLAAHQAAKGERHVKLTRKQKRELATRIARVKQTARALDTAGKGLTKELKNESAAAAKPQGNDTAGSGAAGGR